MLLSNLNRRFRGSSSFPSLIDIKDPSPFELCSEAKRILRIVKAKRNTWGINVHT